MNKQEHWQRVYKTKSVDDVSWYQASPKLSLQLVMDYVSGAFIDVGTGASLLTDALLEQGISDITLLDISDSALAEVKQRLKTAFPTQADKVTYVCTDITDFNPSRCYQLWHDRAVFHFLTQASERKAYVDNLLKCIEPDGIVIISSFAIGGPEKCSGLSIVQYDAEKIQNELGSEFELIQQSEEVHQTPFNTTQAFNYFVFKRNKQNFM